MSSTSNCSDSEYQNVLWEHGDVDSDSIAASSCSPVQSTHTSLLPPSSPQDIEFSGTPPPTPGLTSPLSTLELSSQESIFFPTSSSTPVRSWKRGNRTRRSKFHGNQFTPREGTPCDSSISDSSPADTSFTHPHPKRLKYTLPRRGYISKYSQPFSFRIQNVHFERTSGPGDLKASKPNGMRILDVSILAQAISHLSCQHCRKPLTLYESQFLHGWQTTFFIKCNHCHHLFAEFPSSKPMGIANSQLINASLPKHGMNEVTMRSVLAVHCSGSSWRDLHKFASIFDMPAPFEHMPSNYLNKVESIVIAAADESMKAAAEDLHLKIDSVPSSFTDCINTAVSFDSSWKTRGFYSNLGFGSAIAASTGKVLDYVLLNRTCEKCNRWPAQRQERQPEQYLKWYSTHKDYCLKNFSGSSQAMEPEAAKIIWGRSIQTRKLCYTTFIGDGDSKSYNQICTMNPYNPLPIHKEECVAHVIKRLRKALSKIKKNTSKHSYVQHKLSEPKAEYVSSNFSTVVLQNRGSSPVTLSKAVSILLSHISGDHTNCPEDSWCRWRQTASTSKPPPTAPTHLNANDIAKVTEVFQTYGCVEFCSHLTLGMTQNKNESLHNVIWNFCPKSKYISPQSVRMSTAIAVTIFNEGEVSLYGIMKDLELNPSYTSFSSLCKRELMRQRKRNYIRRSNVDRRARRQKRSKLRREQELLRLEGGKSYRSSSFGAETFKNEKKYAAPRRRGSEPSPVVRRGNRRGKGVKRRIIPEDESDDSLFHFTDSDTDDSDASNVSICEICDQIQPPQERHRSISRWSRVKWVQCDICSRSFHQCCADIPRGVDVSTLPFKCFHCA